MSRFSKFLIVVSSLLMALQSNADEQCFTGQQLLNNSTVTFPSRPPLANSTSIKFGPGLFDRTTLINIPLIEAGVLTTGIDRLIVNFSVRQTRVQTDSDLAAGVSDGAAAYVTAAQNNFDGHVITYRLDQAQPTYEIDETFFNPFLPAAGIVPIGEAFFYLASVDLSGNLTPINSSWNDVTATYTLQGTLNLSQGIALQILGQDAAEAYRINDVCVSVNIDLDNDGTFECPEVTTSPDHSNKSDKHSHKSRKSHKHHKAHHSDKPHKLAGSHKAGKKHRKKKGKKSRRHKRHHHSEKPQVASNIYCVVPEQQPPEPPGEQE